MKRTYTKPELFCEEYELSVSIAANCGFLLNRDKAGFNDPNTCAYQIGRKKYFAMPGTCYDVVVDGDLLQERIVCYNQPAEDQTVFLS